MVQRGGKIERSGLGAFGTALEAARAVAAAQRSFESTDGSSILRLMAPDGSADPMAVTLEAAAAGGGMDINKLFKIADRQDMEDGHREVLELHKSERSESGYKGVHKCGGKWQTQVYHEGQLYHVGAHDGPEACARTHAVCMRLVEKLRTRGMLTEGAAYKNARRMKRKDDAPVEGLEAGEALQFDGDDAARQPHPNTKADTGCQGVYHNPHVGAYAAVAPGNAMLGYYRTPKEAAVAFSRHVAEIARSLGKRYGSRPWPRSNVDRRRFVPIKLTSCAPPGGGTATPEAVQRSIEVAECVYAMVER
eukprot:4487500-Prymnesium_polylepis.1